MIWEHTEDIAREQRDNLQRLLGLKSEIHPDGNTAMCRVAFTEIDPIDVHVTLPEVSLLLHEFREVSGQMIARQRVKPDHGAEQLLALAEAALHPADVDVMVCPFTADRIVTMQFSNHAPIAFRMTPEEVAETQIKIGIAAARAAH